jgi:hypothetical protein
MRWRRPATIVNERLILSSERMFYEDYGRRCSIENKILAVILKGLAPRRTDWWLAASREVTLTLNPVVACKTKVSAPLEIMIRHDPLY